MNYMHISCCKNGFREIQIFDISIIRGMTCFFPPPIHQNAITLPPSKSQPIMLYVIKCTVSEVNWTISPITHWPNTVHIWLSRRRVKWVKWTYNSVVEAHSCKSWWRLASLQHAQQQQQQQQQLTLSVRRSVALRAPPVSEPLTR